MTSETNLDTLLVGLDAACLPVLEALFSGEAAVPTLEDLFERGASGPLESGIPPWTPSAWPSLYTGTNPGKHGVYGFLDFEGYDWDVVNATDVRRPALWELLDSRGKSSVVVNVPVTHPPRAFDGALVPGYVAPENPTGHPEGVLREVREAIGEYRVYPRHTASTNPSIGAMIAEYEETIGMRGAAFRHLASEYDPEFGFLQFQNTDTVFHECPGEDRAVRAVYEAVDTQITRTIEECDPETILLVSDHGMGSYGGYECRLNSFLRETGYVETARGGGMPSWGTVRDEEFLGGEGSRTRLTALAARAMGAAARAGITSQRIGAVLEALGLDSYVIEHVPDALIGAGTERVDFETSKAFVRDRIELGVRINLEGREPDGVVSPADYESVREELIEELSALETPAGASVFEDVARREAYYEGPHTERAADVLTVPREFDEFLSAGLRESVFGPPSEPYNHKREGVIAAAGVGIDTEASLSGADLFDVAPTVLASLCLPTAEAMDGEVLDITSSPGSEDYPVSEPGPGRAETDERAVESRLSDLGYLE